MKGRILFVEDELLLKSIGYQLYLSSDNGMVWSTLVTIPLSFSGKIISMLPLLMRVMRKGIYKVLRYEKGFVIFVDKYIYYYQQDIKSLVKIGLIKSSRPLYPCIHKEALYYGEYKSNKERAPISIYKFDFESQAWSICYKFSNIRHVHGIFSDPYTQKLWVTTGDLDHESNIYYSNDNFESVKLFIGGSQKCRAIYLHFTLRSIIYGTDAPDDRNFIFEISRAEKNIIKKDPVGGPVFYGGAMGKTLLLSTAVEPTDINETKYMELWANTSGVWVRCMTVTKDFLPKKIFQYGQIIFPEGSGSKDYLFFTPIAGDWHGCFIRVAYSDLKLRSKNGI